MIFVHITGFASFLVMLPSLTEDGRWCYEVDAIPKPATKPEPYKGTVKVIKLWRDGDKIEQRPASITVDIYKDEALFQTVELTAKDNWTYTWDTDEAAIWTVVERNVPKGYDVAVNNGSNGILQITNSAQHEKDPDPVTGDTSNPYLWIIIMAAAGIVLAAAALFLHKKKDAE